MESMRVTGSALLRQLPLTPGDQGGGVCGDTEPLSLSTVCAGVCRAAPTSVIRPACTGRVPASAVISPSPCLSGQPGTLLSPLHTSACLPSYPYPALSSCIPLPAPYHVLPSAHLCLPPLMSLTFTLSFSRHTSTCLHSCPLLSLYSPLCTPLLPCSPFCTHLPAHLPFFHLCLIPWLSLLHTSTCQFTLLPPLHTSASFPGSPFCTHLSLPSLLSSLQTSVYLPSCPYPDLPSAHHCLPLTLLHTSACPLPCSLFCTLCTNVPALYPALPLCTSACPLSCTPPASCLPPHFCIPLPAAPYAFAVICTHLLASPPTPYRSSFYTLCPAPHSAHHCLCPPCPLLLSCSLPFQTILLIPYPSPHPAFPSAHLFLSLPGHLFITLTLLCTLHTCTCFPVCPFQIILLDPLPCKAPTASTPYPYSAPHPSLPSALLCLPLPGHQNIALTLALSASPSAFPGHSPSSNPVPCFAPCTPD